PRITHVAHGHRRKSDTKITHAAGNRTVHCHQLRSNWTVPRARIVGRYASQGRTQSGNAAAERGMPDRSAEVRAVSKRADAARERTASPPARPAAGNCATPGIYRLAVEIIVGKPAPRKLRRVGPADDDRTGPSQIRNRWAVFLRDQIGESHDAPARRLA